jgi:hypothetical protein
MLLPSTTATARTEKAPARSSLKMKCLGCPYCSVVKRATDYTREAALLSACLKAADDKGGGEGVSRWTRVAGFKCGVRKHELHVDDGIGNAHEDSVTKSLTCAALELTQRARTLRWRRSCRRRCRSWRSRGCRRTCRDRRRSSAAAAPGTTRESQAAAKRLRGRGRTLSMS